MRHCVLYKIVYHKVLPKNSSSQKITQGVIFNSPA